MKNTIYILYFIFHLHLSVFRYDYRKNAFNYLCTVFARCKILFDKRTKQINRVSIMDQWVEKMKHEIQYEIDMEILGKLKACAETTTQTQNI